MDVARSREAEAFLDACQHTDPEVVSACEGWTAHEVTAHLAAAAAEVTRHLTRGDENGKSGGWEPRPRPRR